MTPDLRSPPLARRALRLFKRALNQTRCDWGKITIARKIVCSDPLAQAPDAGFELHILVCKNDFLNSLWSLKSFYKFSGLCPKLFIHDDGTLEPSEIKTFREHFVHSRVIDRKESDRDLREHLRNYPFCSKFRLEKFSWPSIKLFDFSYYSVSKKFLFFDSDVLFFKRPDQIISCIESDTGFFMSDLLDAFTFPPDQWHALFKVPALLRVNVGLAFIPGARYYDLDLIENCLCEFYRDDSIKRKFWIEQTAWALLFSRHAKHFMRLPETYQIGSIPPINDKTVCHHFVKDDTDSRCNFYFKGLTYLDSTDFMRGLNGVR